MRQDGRQKVVHMRRSFSNLTVNYIALDAVTFDEVTDKQVVSFLLTTVYAISLLINFAINREQKCADTVGTVLVLCIGWPFPMRNYKYISQIKYTEAILSNSTRKLLWFEISKMLIAILKMNLLCYLLQFSAHVRSLLWTFVLCYINDLQLMGDHYCG